MGIAKGTQLEHALAAGGVQSEVDEEVMCPEERRNLEREAVDRAHAIARFTARFQTMVLSSVSVQSIVRGLDLTQHLFEPLRRIELAAWVQRQQVKSGSSIRPAQLRIVIRGVD